MLLRRLLFLSLALLGGCVLNPQGEDPGIDNGGRPRALSSSDSSGDNSAQGQVANSGNSDMGAASLEPNSEPIIEPEADTGELLIDDESGSENADPNLGGGSQSDAGVPPSMDGGRVEVSADAGELPSDSGATDVGSKPVDGSIQ